MTTPAQAIADLALATRARKGTPKIGVAQRHIAADEAEVLADRARRLGLWLARPIADARVQPRSNARNRVAQALHHSFMASSRRRGSHAR